MPAQQAKIQERYEAWSAQGYRVLGVAVKSVSGAGASLFQDR